MTSPVSISEAQELLNRKNVDIGAVQQSLEGIDIGEIQASLEIETTPKAPLPEVPLEQMLVPIPRRPSGLAERALPEQKTFEEIQEIQPREGLLEKAAFVAAEVGTALTGTPLVSTTARAAGQYIELRRMYLEGIRRGIVEFSKRQGEIPQIEDFENLINRIKMGKNKDDRMELQRLFRRGAIPTPEHIYNELDPIRALELIKNMGLISPKLLPTGEAKGLDPSWRWKGEINAGLREDLLDKYPRAAGALDETITQVSRFVFEEIADPNEWILDAAVGGLVLKPGGKVLKHVFPRAYKYMKTTNVTDAARDAFRKFGTTKKAARDIAGKVGMPGLANATEEQLEAMRNLIIDGKQITVQARTDMIVPDMIKKWGDITPVTDPELPVPSRIVEPRYSSRTFRALDGPDIKYIVEPDNFQVDELPSDLDIASREEAEALWGDLDKGKEYGIQYDDKLGRMVDTQKPYHIANNLEEAKHIWHEIFGGDEAIDISAVRPQEIIREQQEILLVDSDILGRTNAKALFTGEPPKSRLIAQGFSEKEIADMTTAEQEAIVQKSIHKNSAQVLDDGNVVITQPENLPPSKIDELTSRNIEMQNEIHRQKEQSGFLTKKGLKKDARERLEEISQRIYGDDTLTNEIINEFKKEYDVRGWWDKACDSLTQILFPEQYKRMRREARRASKTGKYSEEMAGAINRAANRLALTSQAAAQGSHKAAADAYGLWGNLDKKQRKELANLITLRSIMARAKKGIELKEIAEAMGTKPEKVVKVIGGKPLDSIEPAFNDYMSSLLAEGDVGQEVVDAFLRYDEYQKLFTLEHLIKPGKLAEENALDFYAPLAILKYYKPRAFMFNLPRKASPTFKRYLKQWFGSESAVLADIDVIEHNIATVYSDEIYEKGMYDLHEMLDAASRQEVISKFQEAEGEEGLKYINSRLASAKPGDTIVTPEGTTYYVKQFVPGHYMYPGTVIDMGKWETIVEDIAIDIERVNRELFGFTKTIGDQHLIDMFGMDSKNFADNFYRLSAEKQKEFLQNYLMDVGPQGGNAIRYAMIMGKYKPRYLIPEDVYWSFMNMKSTPVEVPFYNSIKRFTGMWKEATITFAGIPFQEFQFFFVDGLNQFMTAPGSFKHIPKAAHILWNLDDLMRDPYYMGPEVKETLDILVNEGVLESGLMTELLTAKAKAKNPITWLRGLERASAKRELVHRVAMAHYQLHDRVKMGLPVEAPWMERELIGLNEIEQVGYISREFSVNFTNTPDWYKKGFRGFLFPFITGVHKGAANWAKMVRRLPAKRPARFFGPVVALPTALYIYNNTGWRKEVFDRMGWTTGKLYSFPINAWDIDDDGKNDYALVFSPRTQIDEAMEWIGFDKALYETRKAQARLRANPALGAEQVARDALRNWLNMWRDWGNENPLSTKPIEMINPLIQAFIGLTTNKDPFDKQPVIPDTVIPNSSEADRIKAEYFMGKAMSPIANLFRPRYGTKKPNYRGPTEIHNGIRRLTGWLLNGPLDIARGAGFTVVDLRKAEMSEAREILYDATHKDAVYKRKFIEIYEKKGNPGFDGAVEFWIQAIGEVSQMNQPGYKRTAITKLFEDAQKDGVALDIDLYRGMERVEGLLNRILSPGAQANVRANILDIGENRTGQGLTEDEKNKLDSEKMHFLELQILDAFKNSPYTVRFEAWSKLMDTRYMERLTAKIEQVLKQYNIETE